MYIYIYTVTDGGMVRSVAPVFIFVCNKKKKDKNAAPGWPSL